MQNCSFSSMSISSSSSSSLDFNTDELRTGVSEPCFWFLGAGVLLARLEAGVPLRGKAGELAMLSLLVVSILRFFAAGFIALAVPFFGAARFLLGAALGFSDVFRIGASVFVVAGEGWWFASFLRSAMLLEIRGPSAVALGRRESAAGEVATCVLF